MSEANDRLLGWLDCWRWLAGHSSPTLRLVAGQVYAEYLRRAAATS